MAIKKTDKTIHIAVDPRIELLAVVQFLSGYDKRYNLITRFDFSYKQDVREHFSEYKDHAAVTLFDKMSAQVFNFDAPPAARPIEFRPIKSLWLPSAVNAMSRCRPRTIKPAGKKPIKCAAINVALKTGFPPANWKPAQSAASAAHC